MGNGFNCSEMFKLDLHITTFCSTPNVRKPKDCNTFEIWIIIIYNTFEVENKGQGVEKKEIFPMLAMLARFSRGLYCCEFGHCACSSYFSKNGSILQFFS